jgi:uncharacterized protein (DUF2267 family)
MPTTGLRQLDLSIHQTNEWLSQLALRLGVRNKQLAYAALRAALHALRSCLPPSVSARVAAELPTPIRGLYFEGWDPSVGNGVATRAFELIEQRLDPALAGQGERVLRAILEMLASRMSRRHALDLQAELPVSLQGLWPTRNSERILAWHVAADADSVRTYSRRG